MQWWVKKLAHAALPPRARLGLMKAYYVGRHRLGSGMEPEMSRLRDFVKAGDCVLDIGANVGAYTVRLARLVGAEGVVHAFEPVPETFEILQHVVHALLLRNVVPHSCAVSDRDGTSAMAIPTETAGVKNRYLAHLVSAKGDQRDGVPVETVTLDSLRQGGIRRVSFIKCDVEGAELSVLRGARGLLEWDRPALLCEICEHGRRFGVEPQDAFDFLHALGYRGSFHREGALVPCEVHRDDVDNYFFVPSSRDGNR
jgi:FkbM family methyltransferase